MRQNEKDLEICYRIIEVLNTHIDGNYLHCGTIASRIMSRDANLELNSTIVSGYVQRYRLMHFHGVERSGELLCIPKHKRLPPGDLLESVRTWMQDFVPLQTNELSRDMFSRVDRQMLSPSVGPHGHSFSSAPSSSLSRLTPNFNGFACFSHVPGTVLSYSGDIASCRDCSKKWMPKPCSHCPCVTPLGVICARCGILFIEDPTGPQ